MESRTIVLTLEKAKEWYNSGNEALKEAALQAYTTKELTASNWQEIKTFEDACEVLGITGHELSLTMVGIDDTSYYKHLKAICKLDIIHKALNKDWNSSLVEGCMYYPYVRFYPADKSDRAASGNNWKLGESFIADGKKYTLVGGIYGLSDYDGLASFNYRYGVVLPILGLLGCKSKKIAEHMSRYFSKEIFEAAYAHHAGTYQWI